MSEFLQGHFPEPDPPDKPAHARWRRRIGRNWAQDVPRHVLERRYGKSRVELEAIAESFKREERA